MDGRPCAAWTQHQGLALGRRAQQRYGTQYPCRLVIARARRTPVRPAELPPRRYWRRRAALKSVELLEAAVAEPPFDGAATVPAITDSGFTTAGSSAAIIANTVPRLVEDCNKLTVNIPFPLFVRPGRFSVERETTGHVASKSGHWWKRRFYKAVVKSLLYP
jgi:hypothetical protein